MEKVGVCGDGPAGERWLTRGVRRCDSYSRCRGLAAGGVEWRGGDDDLPARVEGGRGRSPLDGPRDGEGERGEPSRGQAALSRRGPLFCLAGGGTLRPGAAGPQP